MCIEVFQIHFICGHVAPIHVSHGSYRDCMERTKPGARCATPGFRRPRYWEYIRIPGDDTDFDEAFYQSMIRRAAPGWCHNCIMGITDAQNQQQRREYMEEFFGGNNPPGGITHISKRKEEEHNWDRYGELIHSLFARDCNRPLERFTFDHPTLRKEYLAQRAYECPWQFSSDVKMSMNDKARKEEEPMKSDGDEKESDDSSSGQVPRRLKIRMSSRFDGEEAHDPDLETALALSMKEDDPDLETALAQSMKEVDPDLENSTALSKKEHAKMDQTSLMKSDGGPVDRNEYDGHIRKRESPKRPGLDSTAAQALERLDEEMGVYSSQDTSEGSDQELEQEHDEEMEDHYKSARF